MKIWGEAGERRRRRAGVVRGVPRLLRPRWACRPAAARPPPSSARLDRRGAPAAVQRHRRPQRRVQGGSLRPSTAGRIVGGVGRSPAASSQRPSRRRRCHVRPAARRARRVPKRPSPGQRPAAARRRLVRVGDRREAAQNGGPPPRPPWGAQSVVAPSVAPGISARARRGRTALLVLRRGRLEAESSGAVLLRRRRKGCSAGRPRLSARRTSTAHPSDSAAPPRVAFLHEACCQAGEGPRPEKGRRRPGEHTLLPQTHGD